MFLNNIDKTNPGVKDLLKKDGIAVARLLIPCSLSAVDKTMQESFMKFAKSAGLYTLFIFTKRRKHALILYIDRDSVVAYNNVGLQVDLLAFFLCLVLIKSGVDLHQLVRNITIKC